MNMRAAVLIVVAALLVIAAMAGAGAIYVVSTGLKAQPEPGAMETRMARTIRGFAIPREAKARSNPIGTSAEELKPGLEHFARYCAMCHGNDGSGQGAAIGRGLFPKPPDMRDEATQRLTDGEISTSSKTAFASPVCRRLAPASQTRPARNRYGSSCALSATCPRSRLTRSPG